MTKIGTGTLTLTGVNSYTGTTQIDSGTLAIDGRQAIADTGAVVIGDAGTFEVLNTEVIGSLSGSGTVVLDHTLSAGGDNSSTAYAGTIGGASGLTKIGTGTLTLSGVNTYAGTTWIANGTLAIDSGRAIADTGTVVISIGATFEVLSAETIGSLSGNGAVALAQTLTVGGDNSDTAYAGAIGGASGLAKIGTGTLTLSGTNSYAGTTRIDSGTLAVDGGRAIADTGAVAIGDAGTFRVKTAETIGSLSGSGAVILDQALAVGGDGGSTAYSGAISGADGLVKTGTGTLTLTGTNSYAGGTTVAAGTLQGDTVSIQGNVTDNATLTFAQDFNGVYAGDISGTGTLVKTGSGAVTLDGDASHSGGTRIEGGALIGTTGNLLGAITDNANLVFQQDADGDFAGSISGTGNVYKAGTGTVRLTGTASHAGVTAVMQGRLIGSSDTIRGDISAAQGATLEFDQAADGTYAGSMVDAQGAGLAGQLVKSGAGALTVTGHFGAQGGTLIEQGSLIGTGETLWGDFATRDGTTLRIGEAEGQGADFSGAISGTGSFVKTGTGTLRLSGQSAGFAGSADITAGTILLTGALNGSVLIEQGAALQVGDGTTSGDLLADTTNDGTLTFNQAGSYVYTGALSGNGSLVKQGDGALTLAGDYSYTGSTVVEGGTVTISSLLPTTTTLQIDGGSFYLGSTDQSVSGLTGNGGSLNFGGGTLTVDQDTDYGYDGSLIGTGTLVKSGSGTLNLLGDSSLAGDVLVNAGTLGVRGTLASLVTVSDGATLSGTGTVGGMVVRSGGVAAPGSAGAAQNIMAFRAFAAAVPAPLGTLHVSGNVTFEAGSLYQVNVDAAGESDKIAATGSASLQGGTVQVLAANGSYAPLTHYTLLSANGGVTGAFSDVTSDLAFLTPVLSYSAKTVSLDLVRNNIDFTDVARNRNERNVAGKVTALGVGNPLFNAVLFMDADSAREQFNQLSGEIHASARTAMLNDAALPMTAAIDHLVETPAHSGVWMQGLANWSQIDANGESARTRSNAQGLMGGADIAVARGLRLGLAGSYTHDNLSAPAVGSTAKLKGTHVLGYASGAFAGVELRVGGGYSHFDADTVRAVPVAGAAQRLSARYGVDVVQGFGEMAYPLKLGDGAVAPYGNVAVTNIARPNFAETGGSIALASAKANDTTAISSVGIRFETAPAGAFSVGGKLGWEHAWGSIDPVSEMTLSGTSGSFEVIGAPLSRNSATVVVNGRLHLSKGLTVSAGYEGRIGSSNQSNAVKGAIGLRF
nr:autotransporter-associated beta strand repeat-containing protein [Sphingomonas sp. dw_22]